VITAAVPGLMMRLIFSYLRMRRNAIRAEKGFYRSLVNGGIPPKEARELAWEYSSVTSVQYWIKEIGFPAVIGGKKKRR
jgi:hypothetical protein